MNVIILGKKEEGDDRIDETEVRKKILIAAASEITQEPKKNYRSHNDRSYLC